MVADLLQEMADMDWPERRALIDRVLQVAIAALRLRKDTDDETGPTWSEVMEGLVGQVVGIVIDRLGEAEVTCSDQAFVFALSNQEMHRRAARNWFEMSPETFEELSGTMPTVH